MPKRQNLALIQHRDTVRQCDNRTHEVFDEDDRRTAGFDPLDHFDRMVDLGRIQAAKLGLIGQAGEGERLPGGCIDSSRAHAVGAAEFRAEPNVFEDRQIVEQARDLIGARHALLRDQMRRSTGNLLVFPFLILPEVME